MRYQRSSTWRCFVSAVAILVGGIISGGIIGCANPRGPRMPTPVAGAADPPHVVAPHVSAPQEPPRLPPAPAIRQVQFLKTGDEPSGEVSVAQVTVDVPAAESTGDSVEALVETAIQRNPRLLHLYQQYQAASARAEYVAELPDPKFGANVFGAPIETAAGSQRANMNLSQTIPWLSRLDAQQQRACLEAMAIRAEFAAEQLQVVAGVRTAWARLYTIDKQIDIAEANRELLNSLIGVANARIATGQASQGDVLLGTLELSQLEERLLTYRRQRRSVEAEINRLVGRAPETPVHGPKQLPLEEPARDASEIYQIALSHQPEIEAARLRTQATRWGIEVARLMRRPDVTFSASYFATDNNRPPTPVVHVGEDPWALGVQVSLPLWRHKYDSMENEAGWKHQAAHSTVDDVSRRYEARILDVVTEAKRAAETARLYQATILPQARQTLSADQKSYANGSVEFDRVMQDYRNLLTLELGYHKALGDLAIASAQLQQAAGRNLMESPPN